MADEIKALIKQPPNVNEDGELIADGETVDMFAVDFAAPVIVMRNQADFESMIAAYSERYKNMVFQSEAEIKDAKAIRAELNKVEAAIVARVNEISDAYQEPLNIYKADMKRMYSVLTAVRIDIDKSVKSFETAEKSKKSERSEQMINDRLKQLKRPDLQIERRPTWLNKSMKIKKIEEDIDFLIEKAIQAEDALNAEREIVLTFCQNTGLQPDAWLNMLEYRKAAEVIQAINVSLSKKAEKEAEAPVLAEPVIISMPDRKNVQTFSDAPAMASDGPQLITSRIEVQGTREQFAALNTYMVTHGIKVKGI